MLFLIQLVIFNGKHYNPLTPQRKQPAILDEMDLWMTPKIGYCHYLIRGYLKFQITLFKAFSVVILF